MQDGKTRGKTPQQKKAESYENDRHTFGRSLDKGVRIGRRRRKVTANQRFRRRATVALQGLLKTSEPANEENSVTNRLIKSGLMKKRLRKMQSEPLKEAIAIKRRRRAVRAGRRVRRDEREARWATATISFLSRMDKELAIRLVDALELHRDYPSFRAFRQANSELAKVVDWLERWNRGEYSPRRFVDSHPELAVTLWQCIGRIDRIARPRTFQGK